MKKITAIGEALIDFIPQKDGSFIPHLGGAPCNVAGAFTKLSGKATLLTQLGDDLFGHQILDELNQLGIDTSEVKMCTEAKTSLAFVGLGSDGQRTFSFYRNPGADMLYHQDNITDKLFENNYALHFCSVSLVDCPMKQAHLKAIQTALQQHQIISFDPNVRLMLWDDHDQLKKVIWDYLPYAHILKIADEELEFLTGTSDPQKAAKLLFKGNVQLVLITCGANGSFAFTAHHEVWVPSLSVKAIDTTGAGDAFIGSFLYQCAEKEIQDFTVLSQEELTALLTNSSAYAGASVQAHGAISSYPHSFDLQEL